jgi:selenocysteine lyase/cysteine desulfurase
VARGANVVKIDLPEPASHQSLIDAYDSALQRLPNCKLVVLTHLGHRTGLLLPIAEIVELARKRGADVMVDAAHSWGQVDFRIPDLKTDFAAVTLHKWIGAPIGVAVMYIRKERLRDIDPYLGERGPHENDIWSRVHTGTTNFATALTVPTAIDFHERIGVKNKENRLRALRDRWVHAIGDHPGIEILTPPDPRLYAGITSFRFKGKTSKADNIALSRRLAEEHGVFTIFREGVAKGACVRVTPAMYTTFADVDKLASALRKMLG